MHTTQVLTPQVFTGLSMTVVYSPVARSGQSCRSLRQEAGFDQEQVAKLLGKTQSHVSKVEAGQRRIDIVALKEYARIYKKSMDYFLK